MFEIGGFKARHCQGVSRRAFLRAGMSLPAALGVSGALSGTRAAELESSNGKAKSVLLVWLWGGPSHLDMFDPKPEAPTEYRGPFSTIPTRTAGVRFTELVPKIAARSHLYSLVRSNVNLSGDHLIAGSIGLTGAAEGPGGHPPNFGSLVSRFREAENLPSFVSLARGPIGDGRGPMKGHGGGTWGPAYDPFLVDCDHNGGVEIQSLKLLDGLSPQRLADRRALLRNLDATRRRVDTVGSREWTKLHERAYSLLASADAHKAFDLASESEKTRESYGYTSFGQSCLLGRRLVEAGVPYVQVNWSRFVEVLYQFSDYGWDTHANNFELLSDWHCPIVDRAFSALLDDLHERGLLETTLVVCLGEFGRTPRINSIGSRDHWHHVYNSIWAGAGVQPGRVIGESDARGERPVSDPITPATVGTTMLELSGINTQQRAELKILEEGRVIDELL